MVMMHRSSSSGMQSIRRELQRRRPKHLAPKSSVATKSSAPAPPLPAPSLSAPSAIDEHLRPGTEVGVRTRTTTLKTGEVLVLWLRATIVSPTHGGYEVVYDGNWPPGDPYGTVQVPRRHVRVIKPSPSPTTPPPPLPPSSAPSPSASTTAATVAAALKKEMRPQTRPTTAGKSLRLIRRSLVPEMERLARADLHGY